MLYIRLIITSFLIRLLPMITLRFNKFGVSLTKFRADPLDFFVDEIPEQSSNDGLKRLDRRVRG